jgi:NTE family protein
VNIVLQGGGSHAAFSWGVLDYILERGDIKISSVSASSMGALMAAVMTAAMARGNGRNARKMLSSFWRKISISASLSPFQPTFFDKMMGNKNMGFSPPFMALDYITQFFSPYQFNYLDINPIRSIIRETVDFKLLKTFPDIELFIAATQVETGRRRIFNRRELTVDTLLAASCNPFIAKTVMVEGEGYWEGEFSGGAAVGILAQNNQVDDIIIIQSIPTEDSSIPTKVPDIISRTNEISQNAALVAELRQIDTVNRVIRGKVVEIEGNTYRPKFIHMIEGYEILASLDKSSRLNFDWSFLEYLRDAGRQAAEDWFESNLADIGKQCSYNIFP